LRFKTGTKLGALYFYASLFENDKAVRARQVLVGVPKGEVDGLQEKEKNHQLVYYLEVIAISNTACSNPLQLSSIRGMYITTVIMND